MISESLIYLLEEGESILFSEIFYAILIPTFGLIVSHYLLLRREKYTEKRKRNLEEQKKFNRMLFSLLEIRWYIKKVIIEYKTINFYYDEYEKVILKKGKVIPEIKSMIAKQIREILPDNFKFNIEIFKKDIYELSLYFPIQAYELSGKEDIVFKFIDWESKINLFLEKIDSLPSFSDIKKVLDNERYTNAITLFNNINENIQNLILPNIEDKKVKAKYKKIDNGLELDEECKKKIIDLVKKISEKITS